MDRFATFISRVFGVSLLFLSGFVALETVLRKLANTSLQGADELGGYVLAFGSSLAFVVTLIERAHIRIDILHRRFPVRMQAVIDWMAAVSMALLGFSCCMSAGSWCATRFPTGPPRQRHGPPR